MATEQGLHAEITGDSKDLVTAAERARTALLGVEEGIGATGSAASRSGARLSALGRGLRAVRQQSYAVSVQLQDVAVQAAAGTSWFQILGQQMPQLASSFGKTGAMVGLLAAVAFPALGLAVTALGQDTKDYEKQLESTQKQLDEYAAAVDELNKFLETNANTSDLATAAIGRYREELVSIKQADIRNTLKGINEQIANMLGTAGDGDVRSALLSQFDTNIFDKPARALATTFQKLQVQLAAAGDDMGKQLDTLVEMYRVTSELANLRDGVSEDEQNLLTLLSGQIESLSRMKQISEEQADAVTRRIIPSYQAYARYRLASEAEADAANQATYQHMLALQNAHRSLLNQTAEEQRAAMANVYQLYADTRSEGEKVNNETAQAVREARTFADIDLASGVNAAAIAAATLAAKLGVSVEKAKEMIRLAKADAADKAALAEQYAMYGQGKQAERDVLNEQDPYYGGSGNILKDLGFYKDGKSGGSKKTPPSREELQDDLKAFEESLMTEKELILANYDEQIKMLNEFREQKLKTQVGWDELEVRAANERDQQLAELAKTYKEATIQAYSSLFGNLASIVSAGGEKTSRAVKALSIVQGMINSYLAYTQVLANPYILNPALKQTLAYSTLLAGMAQVTAMRNTSTSGGGGGTAASGAAAAAAAEPAGPTYTSQFIIQGDSIGRDTGEGLVRQINEAQRNGHLIELEWMR